jgi:hypothetical protein
MQMKINAARNAISRNQLWKRHQIIFLAPQYRFFNDRFVRIADFTTATSACALMGMPRVLLPYLLIYQAVP